MKNAPARFRRWYIFVVVGLLALLVGPAVADGTLAPRLFASSAVRSAQAKASSGPKHLAPVQARPAQPLSRQAASGVASQVAPASSGPEPDSSDASPPARSTTAPVTVPSTGSVQGVALGLFVGPNASVNRTPINDTMSELGHSLAIIQGFFGWETGTGATIPFPESFASYVVSKGATPLLTWQPGAGINPDQPNFSLIQLASGRYDSYIRSWAVQAKAFGHVLYVRLMHEMNDPVYPWSYGVNGNTNPSEYIVAWTHIVSIFRAVGASNVQFVWCPGAAPASPSITDFFPGDGWVSWVGLDGYNRLNREPWRSFAQLFSREYSVLVAASDRPVMIAETGCVEDPSDSLAKAEWITQAFASIPTEFPRIKAVVYFDSTGRGYSYPITSSSRAFAAFQQVVKSAEYQAEAPQTTVSYT